MVIKAAFAYSSIKRRHNCFSSFLINMMVIICAKTQEDFLSNGRYRAVMMIIVIMNLTLRLLVSVNLFEFNYN